MMRARMAVGALIALCVVVVGCDKKPDGAAGTSTAASNLPVKGPWEAIKLTMIKKDPDGTAHFKVDNLGAKTVRQIYIDIYGYDAKGDEIANVPLKEPIFVRPLLDVDLGVYRHNIT